MIQDDGRGLPDGVGAADGGTAIAATIPDRDMAPRGRRSIDEAANESPEADRLPDEAEDLNAFDVIALGDVACDDLPRDKQHMIERFVSAGDRRRRYVRLLRAPLAGLGVASAPPAGQVVFVHDGNEAAPSYDVTVTDGTLSV